MKKIGLRVADILYFCFGIIVAICVFNILLAKRPLLGLPLQKSIQDTPPIALHVNAATAIGPSPTFIGAAKSPFTLVEFADYQCPACRLLNSAAPALVNHYSGRLRYTFRNYPLSSIHRQAYPAALLAEAARQRGIFWTVHNELMRLDLSKESIDRIATLHHIDQLSFSVGSPASIAVNRDIVCGNYLGVTRTPTYILCCPGRRVILLGSIAQVRTFLN